MDGDSPKFRTNTEVRYDPDWGKVVPDCSVCYRITVKPRKGRKWYFIILIPKNFILTDEELIEDDDRLLKFVVSLCKDILHDKDRFQIFEFTMNDLEEFNTGVPVLSLDAENPPEFHWLKPPKHEMN